MTFDIVRRPRPGCVARESFRHTHDLDYLVTLAAPLHRDLWDTLEPFRPLSIWSVAFRYRAFFDGRSDRDIVARFVVSHD